MQPVGDFPRKKISPKDQKDVVARADEVYSTGQLSATGLNFSAWTLLLHPVVTIWNWFWLGSFYLDAFCDAGNWTRFSGWMGEGHIETCPQAIVLQLSGSQARPVMFGFGVIVSTNGDHVLGID